MIRVFNLATEEYMEFMDSMNPINAVCYAYCEEHKKLSWFFDKLQSNQSYVNDLPVTIGKRTVACGDWSTFRKDL